MENNVPRLFPKQQLLQAGSDVGYPPPPPCRPVTVISKNQFPYKNLFISIIGYDGRFVKTWPVRDTDRIVSPCLTVFKEAANLTACCATRACVWEPADTTMGKTLNEIPILERTIHPFCALHCFATLSRLCPCPQMACGGNSATGRLPDKRKSTRDKVSFDCISIVIKPAPADKLRTT